MWSDCLVFCDCGFHSVCPLMEKDKKLMEASWWERLRGKLDLVLMGRAMFSKPLIQFSVEGPGCVPSLLFDLRPNYGGGDEDNGDFLQKVPCTHCWTQCPHPFSRPPPTHASTSDCWTFTGKSESSLMGSLLLPPGSWWAQGLVGALQESVSPFLCKFWGLYGGANGDLLQEGLCHTQVYCTQSLCPWSSPLLACIPQETLKHSSALVSVGPLGPAVSKVWLSPLSVSGRYGVWF